MATIVNIGGHGYLVAKAADAGAIVKALAGAMALDSCYVNNQKVWFPSKYEHCSEVSMQAVPDTRILNADPKDTPIDLADEGNEAAESKGTRAVVRRARRLNGRTQLLLGNGGGE